MLVKTDRVIYYLTNFTILTFFKTKTTWHLWRSCYVSEYTVPASNLIDFESRGRNFDNVLHILVCHCKRT